MGTGAGSMRSNSSGACTKLGMGWSKLSAPAAYLPTEPFIAALTSTLTGRYKAKIICRFWVHSD